MSQTAAGRQLHPRNYQNRAAACPYILFKPGETLRTKLIAMPARLVHSARRLRLRAPTNWPWRDALTTAQTRIAAIPALT